MGMLCGLKGIKKKKLACEFGSMHIWKDDEGFFRCEAQRYCVTINEEKFANFEDVKKWARKWLKEIK